MDRTFEQGIRASRLGGSFPGTPVGCDPNRDGTVDAADVGCAVLKMFGGQAACGE